MRHALIAGGTGGIGQGIAADLLNQGWRVTLVSRHSRAPQLEAAGAEWVSADCTQAAACVALGLRGPVDALIVATGSRGMRLDTVGYRSNAPEIMPARLCLDKKPS